MENLGALALLLAFCISLYAIVASVAGRLKNKPFLTLSGERAVLAVWLLVTTAAGILIYSLMSGDYRLAYVASHTNRAMPPFYKFAAWWGGQEGSLLFWSWILATYGAVVVLTNAQPQSDAVGSGDAFHRPGLLPDSEQFRRQPLPGSRGRQGDHLGPRRPGA